jgi:hypothetical protein
MKRVIYFSIVILLNMFGQGSVALADENPTVVLFAGYGSSKAQMQNWQQTAKDSPAFGRYFSFEGVALPSHHFEKDAVVRDGRAVIANWVARINNAPKGATFLLVGHSSGSALSNEIARQVSDKSKVKLVVLDGFMPDVSNVETQCWTAKAADSTLVAINFETLKSCKGVNSISVYGCKSPECLHATLVNSSAPREKISGAGWTNKIYDNLEPNLSWLNIFIKKRGIIQNSIGGAVQ